MNTPTDRTGDTPPGAPDEPEHAGHSENPAHSSPAGDAQAGHPGDPGGNGADAVQNGSASSADLVSGTQALAMADPAHVRRAPRLARFGVLGGVIGLALCALATLLFAEPTEFISLPGVFLLISVFMVPVFVLAACVVALLLDGRSRCRQRQTR